METTGLQGPRIALLIDFDNVVLGVDEPPGFDIELVVNALRSRGVVVLGRAYGDWYRHSRHRRKLMEQGIELVETPAFGPIIKNSADIRIALDGLEIGMTQHHIQEFCLVSGDSDFLPLIKRLQYLGKSVVVISGVKFTSELVRRNCNEFISYENLVAESVGATEDATTLEGAFVLLARTIHTLHERGMEVRSSTVKQMMLQLNPVFSERNFGCSQFKQFLDKGCRAGIIKLGRRDPNSGEFTVLLPSDFEEELPIEAAPVEAIEPRRTRTRTPRIQAADEDLGLHALAADESAPEEESAVEPSTPAAGANGTDTNVANRALRRGRLRFSGKTWKGTSRSVLQSAANGEGEEVAESTPATEVGAGEQGVETLIGEQMGGGTPALSPAPARATRSSRSARSKAESAAPADEEPASEPAEATAQEAVAEEAMAEGAVAEEAAGARKRGTRGGRRRKAATKTAAGVTEETSAAEATVSEAAETPEPIAVEAVESAASEEAVESEVADAGDEAKPKAAPKKATRRRRAPAKKKAE